MKTQLYQVATLIFPRIHTVDLSTWTQCGTYLNRSVVSLPENHSALKLLGANASTNYRYVGYRAVVAKTKMS